jgi:hypothetical protein
MKYFTYKSMSTFNPFMLSLMSRVGEVPTKKSNMQGKESIIKMDENYVDGEQNSFKMIPGEEKSISTEQI